MKKIFTILLLTVISVSLFACGGKDNSSVPTTPDTTEKPTGGNPTPEVPETPETPEVPEIPEVPETPETPVLGDVVLHNDLVIGGYYTVVITKNIFRTVEEQYDIRLMGIELSAYDLHDFVNVNDMYISTNEVTIVFHEYLGVKPEGDLVQDGTMGSIVTPTKPSTIDEILYKLIIAKAEFEVLLTNANNNTENFDEFLEAYNTVLTEVKNIKDIVDLEVFALKATIAGLEVEKASLEAAIEVYKLGQLGQIDNDKILEDIKKAIEMIASLEAQLPALEAKLVELNNKLATATSWGEKAQLRVEIGIVESSIAGIKVAIEEQDEIIAGLEAQLDNTDYEALIAEAEAKISTIDEQLVELNKTLEISLVVQEIVNQVYATLVEIYDQGLLDVENYKLVISVLLNFLNSFEIPSNEEQLIVVLKDLEKDFINNVIVPELKELLNSIK